MIKYENLNSAKQLITVFADWKKLIGVLRVYNTRSMLLFYLLGRSISGSFQLGLEEFVTFCVFMLIYGSVSIMNFVFDRKVDQINKKAISINFSLQNMYLIMIILNLIALFVSSFVLKPFNLLLVILSVALLGFLYSHPKFQFSHKPVAKFTFMLLVYTIIPGVLGLSYSRISYEHILLLFGFSLIYGSFIIYSDIPDIKGDKMFGKKTLAVIFGYKKLPLFGLFLSLIGILILMSASGFFYNTYLLLITLLVVFFQGLVVVVPKILLRETFRRIGGWILLIFLILSILIFSF